MGQIRAGWLSADGSHDSVLVKQSECVVEPLLTPPLPAESCALPSSHQVPPNLLLHPELNVGKTSARVPYRKVAKMSGNACQLNRSMQHLLGVYSQEFGILKFFLDADLTAAPLCLDPLGYNQTGWFS